MDTNEFFTKLEIASQPDTWHETLNKLAEGGLGTFPGVQGYEQVVFIGCGSTHYLSIWAARATQAETGVQCWALPSSELMLFSDAWLVEKEKTLLVAISRSGQTSETLEALEMFKARGRGETLAITCYPESALADRCDYLIEVPAGQEQSVAQTRSFTNMMLAATALALGPPSSAVVESVPLSARDLLQRHTALAEQIAEQKDFSRFFYLGSHALFGLASEAMLKMKEMSLSYAEAFHFLEFRHGPMSMISDQSVVVGLLEPRAGSYELAVLRDMKALGAQVAVVAPQGAVPNTEAIDHLIAFSNIGGLMWEQVLYLPILQLIALERALAKGLNPDSPKNLEAVVVLE